VTWAELDELANTSHQRAADLWEGVKQAALGAVRSGDYAAAVLDGHKAVPFERALFLALRAELAEGLRPQNGLERQLVDMMAQAQATMYSSLRGVSVRDDYACKPCEPPGAMADRFNRMFLRTLRAFQDLRRGPPAVLVQNLGGQVNVANVQANGQNGRPHSRKKGRQARGTNGECTCPADRRALLG
jgi:hypothetical protein